MGQHSRRVIEAILNRMAVGQRACFNRHDFEGAYPCDWPTIYHTHEQAFLSSRPGAAWGGWRVHYEPLGNQYVVERAPEGRKRVYVDPDRADFYNRKPDGTLVRKEERLG